MNVERQFRVLIPCLRLAPDIVHDGERETVAILPKDNIVVLVPNSLEELIVTTLSVIIIVYHY